MDRKMIGKMGSPFSFAFSFAGEGERLPPSPYNVDKSFKPSAGATADTPADVVACASCHKLLGACAMDRKVIENLGPTSPFTVVRARIFEMASTFAPKMSRHKLEAQSGGYGGQAVS